MGAKQSKRSVDISGKEAEGASEIAAAGAGGEGRVEAIADVDNLKPQINGDAQHITPPEEKTDKEKQLDIATPENEKDATTEKESKEKEDDKETAPATNGESEKAEPEKENGETPAPEEAKKPKKEKVKKKWSLRSISFSRKDKPKQEKKQKDEEAKTNGEPEKVPEEAAEAVAVAESKPAEEAAPQAEPEKTPETPVTEPITNGSPAPASPAETPAVAIEPEQLPINGLSLEESTPEPSSPAETAPEKPIEKETIPEIPEVCAEPPTIESTPPPLPANPPPSSVASFAATTMAPELTDAALANITEKAPSPAEVEVISTPELPASIPAPDSPIPVAPAREVSPSPPIESPLPPNESPLPPTESELPPPTESPLPPSESELPPPNESPLPVNEIPLPPTESPLPPAAETEVQDEPVEISQPTPVIEVEETPVVPDNVLGNNVDKLVDDVNVDIPNEVADETNAAEETDSIVALPEPIADEPPRKEIEAIAKQTVDEILVDAEKTENIIKTVEINDFDLVNSNHVESNGIGEPLNGKMDETEQENLKNKTKDALAACNGEEPADSSPPEPQDAAGDKLAELAPALPPLNADNMTVSDVAVAN